MSVSSWQARRQRRRLQRGADRIESSLTGPVPAGKAASRPAREYGRILRLALRLDPPLAARLFRDFDARVPAGSYPLAFGPGAADQLAGLAARDDRHVLSVVFELATRLHLDGVQRETRDRLADVLGRHGDADLLVTQLLRWQDLGLLEADTLTRSLRAHLARAPLARDEQLWSSFFARLPEPLLPELFDVRCFLGRGAEAVALADSPARHREAMECCARSPRLGDVRAGLELAQRLEDAAAVRKLSERAGDMLFEADRFADALPYYLQTSRGDRISACHERLGQYPEALAACPADQPDRLARLAGLGLPAVDALVRRQEFEAAARQVRELATHLDRASPATEAVRARRDEAASLRAAVLAAGRDHFATVAAQAAAGQAGAGQAGAGRAAGEQAPGVRSAYTAWSRFEEQAGELSRAAALAEDGGDRYRAHRLYRADGRFGEADRVLKDERTPDSLASRASAREAGGDLVGAGRLYEESGRPADALPRYERAGAYAAAARCLIRLRGDDAIGDPRLAGWLRSAGDVDELVRLCLRAAGRPGSSAVAAGVLRELKAEGAVPALLEPDVDGALEAIGLGPLRRFEERAGAWVAQARAETDRRFAGIWGLDLGTTTCAVAIYDTATTQPVLCPWKGNVQFASTLAVDSRGHELVGLSGEELLAGWLAGHVSGAKRTMGSARTYLIADRSYRSEDVAARMIGHARGLVESFLEARVRERVGELARAELGEVREDWLDRAGHQHDLRLDRPRAIVTIPAYFTNNQKHATRDACAIAGVDLVRMIHEPTAACMTAARERRLTGRIVVVDLGAGTLDLSFLEVDDNAYDVQQVVGDTRFGGQDFDQRISAALAGQLAAQAVPVPQTEVAGRRLQVAAEYLKISLSSQAQAGYTLVGFAGHRDARLTLSRAELAEILAEPLATLRQTCAGLSQSLHERPEHLVAVGGPMLSPLVSDVVEAVFGIRRTPVPDPRTAVARGAALQAATLDGKLEEPVLLDVTPLPLGIRSVDPAKRDSKVFSVLVDKNTHIPVDRQEEFTTAEDNQTAVDVEIYNGQVGPGSKIGQFRLDGIPPARAGVPQIEVTFSIDASCVLKVTARDRGTGRSQSITVTDTTLLSPRDRDDMARRYQAQRELDELKRRLPPLIDQAADTSAEAAWREFRDRLAAHRPAASPLAAQTERALAEMFNETNDVEVELRLVQGPLRDLAVNAREFLARPGRDDDLDEARHLERELRAHLDRLRPQLERLAGWNALLVRLAIAGADPLSRFRSYHDAGEFARALRALGELRGGVDRPEDVRRQLRCLAEIQDAERYGEVLAANAARLGWRTGAVTGDPDRPERFARSLRSAVVRVRAGPGRAGGSGFLISDRLVVTNRHWLAGRAGGGQPTAETAQVEIGLADGTAAVEHIFLPDASHSDVAVLRLAEAAAADPLRLGYPALVRIGDQVQAVAAAPGGPAVLVSGLVDRFEIFAEQDLRLFRTGLSLGSASSGGPLLNDLGEVVGVLTIGEPPPGTATVAGAFALSVDALDPLLRQAGFAGHG
jgi:molecular chaperone DnaK